MATVSRFEFDSDSGRGVFVVSRRRDAREDMPLVADVPTDLQEALTTWLAGRPLPTNPEPNGDVAEQVARAYAAGRRDQHADDVAALEQCRQAGSGYLQRAQALAAVHAAQPEDEAATA